MKLVIELDVGDNNRLENANKETHEKVFESVRKLFPEAEKVTMYYMDD